jgi:hypothetical protein
VSLPLPLKGKIKVDRRDESLFLFLEILPGKIHTFAPGRSIRSLPGLFQFFPIFTFKGSLPGISKFYSSWKLRFRAPSQEFPKMLAAGKSAASYHLLPAFSKEKNFQKFPKMLAAGKPFFYQILQQLGNPFIGKRSRKRKMYFYGST